MKLILNTEYGLYEKGGRAFCDSLMVAREFKKEHSMILKTLEGEQRKPKPVNGLLFELSQSGVNTRDYFIKTSYKDSRNRPQPMYLMSRDGFTLLTMGFTGARALKFKLEYIRRFNDMEQFIQSLLTTKFEFPAFTDAVMLAHDEPKHFHFSNEINMIYKIVLGMNAKQYREANGLVDGEGIKPHLSLDEVKAVETLQRIDIGLMEIGLGYDQRKATLAESHCKRLRLIS